MYFKRGIGVTKKYTALPLTQRVTRCIMAMLAENAESGGAVMPRKENLEFLTSIYPADTSKGYDGLIEKLFGKSPTIEVCAKKAYRTLQRNLGGIGKMDEQEKRAWRSGVEKLIDRCITDLLSQKLHTQKEFDTWHNETCEEIIKISRNVPEYIGRGFAYGLAQKWLNIAIKNMIVVEQWESQLDRIKQYLHVPVDNYIMGEAQANEGMIIPSNQPWSKWEYTEYITFQKALREKLNGTPPIEWEFDVWAKSVASKKGIQK